MKRNELLAGDIVGLRTGKGPLANYRRMVVVTTDPYEARRYNDAFAVKLSLGDREWTVYGARPASGGNGIILGSLEGRAARLVQLSSVVPLSEVEASETAAELRRASAESRYNRAKAAFETLEVEDYAISGGATVIIGIAALEDLAARFTEMQAQVQQ